MDPLNQSQNDLVVTQEISQHDRATGKGNQSSVDLNESRAGASRMIWQDTPSSPQKYKPSLNINNIYDSERGTFSSVAEEPEIPHLTRKWDQANKTASIMSQSMIIAESF